MAGERGAGEELPVFVAHAEVFRESTERLEHVAPDERLRVTEAILEQAESHRPAEEGRDRRVERGCVSSGGPSPSKVAKAEVMMAAPE